MEGCVRRPYMVLPGRVIARSEVLPTALRFLLCLFINRGIQLQLMSPIHSPLAETLDFSSSCSLVNGRPIENTASCQSTCEDEAAQRYHSYCSRIYSLQPLRASFLQPTSFPRGQKTQK